MEYPQIHTDLYQYDGFSIETGIIKGIQTPIFTSYESLGEMIWDNLSNSPEHVAQIDAATGREKTFKDVKERSIRLALWMTKKGIRPGDIITLCSPDHFDVDVIIFATQFVGAIYNAFPCRIDLEQARRFIKHIEPRVLFVCKDKSGILEKAAELENHECKIIILNDEDNGEQSFANILKERPSDKIENFQITKSVSQDSLCLISPTSGTTGNPKFVSYTHENFLQRSPRNDTANTSSNESGTILLYVFPEWEAHFECVLVLLLIKSTKIFVGAYCELHETARIIEKYKIKHLVISAYRALCYSHADAVSKYNLDSVLTITVMGGVLPTRPIKKLNTLFPNASLQKLLGSSEVRCISKYTKKSRNPESQGTVLPNVQLKIVDEITGETLGPNEIGEICVRSPFIMTGSYKNPIETALSYDGEGWFHTGDEAYYDEKGEIVVTGRLKDNIRCGGCQFQSNLFEQKLMTHPDIFDAAVVSIPDDHLVEKPVACVKKLHDSKITEQDVQNLINQLEFGHCFENSIVFLDEIPRTTNGKINKRILKKQVEQLFTRQPETTLIEE